MARKAIQNDGELRTCSHLLQKTLVGTNKKNTWVWVSLFFFAKRTHMKKSVLWNLCHSSTPRTVSVVMLCAFFGPHPRGSCRCLSMILEVTFLNRSRRREIDFPAQSWLSWIIAIRTKTNLIMDIQLVISRFIFYTSCHCISRIAKKQLE